MPCQPTISAAATASRGLLILLSALWVTASVEAEVHLSPFGAAVAVDENQSAEITLQLTNDDPETEVEFEIGYYFLDYRPIEERQARGPRRDEPGDILRELQVPFYNTVGMAWDPENALMWGLAWSENRLYAINPDNGQAVRTVGTGSVLGMFHDDGILYIGGYNNASNVIYRFDTNGQALGNLNSPVNLTWTTIAGDDRYLFTVAYPNGNGQGDVHVFNMQDNMREVGVIDLSEWMGNEVWGIEVVHDHRNGWLWACNRGEEPEMFQFRVDEDWNAELVQRFPTVISGHTGLAHDGENLWRGTYDGQTRIWYVIDDGVVEKMQLNIDPQSGVIPAEDSVEITLEVITEGLPAGYYSLILQVRLSEPDERRDQLENVILECALLVTIGGSVATVNGMVTDAVGNHPFEGALVNMDRYALARISDGDGIYAFSNLPLGVYEFTFTAPEYLPLVAQLELDEAREYELNVALLHSECIADRDRIDAWLEVDSSRAFQINVTNQGNGPLAYTTERRLPGGAEARPWEQRFSFPAGQEVQDNRLKGVAFANDKFYITGIGDEQTMIYVLDRDGAMVNSFPQVGTARNGMDGIAFDGELLWGAGENRIYGFTTDGDSVTSFRGVQRTTRAITWDWANEWLWTADATSDIIAVTREGEEGPTIRRQNQTIHALAFFEDDPDSSQLYVLSTLNDTLALRKMSLQNGGLNLVAILEPEGGGVPSGACISSSYDYYSTVFISTVDAPEEDGGDRIDIWQVQGNTGWMHIDPTAGEIAAQESQAFTLTLDATDLVELLDYEGQVVWIHDGFGGETAVDILLRIDVVPPPLPFHLLEPADGDTLSGPDATFIWESLVLPEPDDELIYQLWLKQDEDSVMTATADTAFTIPLVELGLEELDVHVPVQWWVVAVYNLDEMESRSRFHFYLPGSRAGDNPVTPAEFALYGSYPNPFNSQTRVSFSVPSPSSVTQTFLSVYDLSGRRVADLWAGQTEAGVHEVVFDAAGLASGVYVVQLESAGQTARLKIALVR